MVLNLRGWMLMVVALALVVGHVQSAEPERLVRGGEFRRAWGASVSARIDQQSLVQVLDHFCGSRRIAWVIDRRLDPDQNVSSNLPLSPLSELLPQLLSSIHAGVVAIGPSLVIGPRDKLIDLRTLVEIQRLELQHSRQTVPRKQALAQTIELHWVDLAEPRQLVEQVTQRAKIDLAGVEQIPHDQWKSGDLIGLTAGETLAVLAWQYDLQLHWQEDGRAALVPAVLPSRITRSFTIPETRHEAVKSKFPQLAWSVEGNSFQATGRIEELESVDQWLKGNTKPTPPPRPKPKQEPKDWRDRSFTLRIKHAPLRDVLAALKQQGIPLEWNEEELVAAGIDMKAKMELRLNNATSEELLSALCSSSKLKYEITEKSAKLSAQ